MVFDVSFNKARGNVESPALQSNFLFHILDTGDNPFSDVDVKGFDFSKSEIPEFIEGHVEEAAYEALNVQTERFNHSTQSAPFVSDMEDNSISLTLIEDSDYTVLRFFESWLRLIRNTEDDGTVYTKDGKTVAPKNARNTVNPPSVYQKNAEMILFDPNSSKENFTQFITNPGKIVDVKSKIKFKKIVPSNISESDYTYEDGAGKVPMVIDFAFEDYEFTF